MYRRLCKTIEDSKYQLVDSNTNFTQIALTNPKIDYYTSIYMYNDFQKEQFDKTGSIRGIKDVVTDWLVWDFDSSDFDAARKDAMELFYRLRKNLPEEGIKLFYSGSKGIHVEVHTSNVMNVEEFKAITKQLANGLDTYDRRINDHARAFRIAGSLHPKTKRYKIPLSINDLESLSKEEIEAGASDPSNIDSEAFNYYIVSLPSEILSLGSFKEDYKPKITNQKLDDIDWSIRPKHLNNCRWALQNGAFGEGDRNNALLCLAATYKNQGDNIDICYRRLKGVCETQAKRNNCERYSDGELYNNIVSYVYNDDFNNGQFTCRKPENWLYDYCQSLGSNKCNHKEEEFLIKTDEVFSLFKTYTEKYEENILYTGIPELDEKMKFMVGTSNGILAPPGVGKTSLCLQILEHNSLKDVPCLFYSYDMFHSALYIRMFQRESKLSQDQIYSKFKDDSGDIVKYASALNEKYKNVQFCFKSGQTIDELERTIEEATVKLGRKPKLVIVDYNELVLTNVSDSTASSSIVAQRLRQIANDQEVCIITLLQPAKQYCSPGDEITNFNSVKGSSAIVQSLTLLLGCSRPGFNPLQPENDKFFNITCLKNRNGPLFSLDLSWNGLTGRINTLNDEDKDFLNYLREQKKINKAGEESW